MVRAYPLVIMGCINNGNILTIPLSPASDFINHRGRNLEIKIIQMDDIRFETIQHNPYFPPCLHGINNFERIK